MSALAPSLPLSARIPRVLRAASRMPVSQARQAVRLAALMCAGSTDPGMLFSQKVSVPSDMLSLDWNPKKPGEGSLKEMIPAWIRERAFFMAGVERAEVLDGFRQVTQRYVAGEINKAKAKELLADMLRRTGYAPKPEHAATQKVDSIKDLRSDRRQDLVLDLHNLQVHEYLRWVRAQESLGANPARRLVRFRNSKKKRDWATRWNKALSQVPHEGATDARQMVALVNHPIWVVLSRFSTPWPPFDFNSGMGLRVVGRSEADELGLLPDPESTPEHRAMMQPQDKSLNEIVECHPEISSQEIRDELARRLEGFAEWTEDGRLLMTDPNGTRVYDKHTLTKIASAKLPEGFFPRQWNSLKQWAKTHTTIKWMPGADATYHAVRYAERTIPETGNEVLWRGEGFESRTALLARIASFTKDSFHLGGNLISFSKDRSAAEQIAKDSGPWKLIIRCDRHHSARDISPAIDIVAPENSWQKEVVFLGRSEFTLSDPTEKGSGQTIIVHLREAQ